MAEPMRLQRFLARAGVCSRRAAERLIEDGRVSVDGLVVIEQGVKVDPDTDEVRVDGLPVRLSGQDPVVLMLNKPAGYLTSMSDPHAQHLVSELLPLDRFPGLFPVGRLDLDTTGLLLFTTDGELGNALLHPAQQVDKVYEAVVEGRPDHAQIAKLERGVQLEDGMTAPACARVLQGARTPRHPGLSLVELTIHEGRKRQVKRMCQAIGCPVVALHRTALGPLRLGGLPLGSWRTLDAGEVQALRQVALQ